MYVTNATDNSVSVIDTATHEIIQVKDPLNASSTLPYIGVGLAPYGIAVNPSGTGVYVANSASNSVSVIDALNNAVTASPVPVGNMPYGIAAHPSKPKIYVTNYGGNSVSVIDTSNNTLLYNQANGVAAGKYSFSKPYGVAVDPKGDYVYVANEGSNRVSVIKADIDTVLFEVQVGSKPHGVAVNRDGKVYVVNSAAGITGEQGTVSVIEITDFANGLARVTTLDGLGALPNFIAFNPAGTLAYVTNYQSNNISAFDVAAANLAPSAVPAGAGPYSFGQFVGPAIRSATAQDFVTVYEFYHAGLNHYFRTASAAEASGIDSGAAGPGWVRTGDNFKAYSASATSGGAVSVCRFYGSMSPGPNSHFYTASQQECDGLKALQQNTPASEKRWNYEGLAFSISLPPASGCPAGFAPVYRLYNNGYSKGEDSNHRYTTLLYEYQRLISAGWSGESVVMCSPL